MYNPSHIEKIRRLTLALAASGLLNVAVLSFLFYWVVKERIPVPYFEHKPAAQEEQELPFADNRNCGQVVSELRNLTFEQLVGRLSQTQLVESGLTQRDLAIAALVAFHHFDLQRALVGLPQPQQQRGLICTQSQTGKMVPLLVFPGMTDEQFQAIIQFAHMERWPLTGKGIYLLLQKKGMEAEPSLIDAFYLSKEFMAVELLFSRAPVPVDKKEIMEVLSEGSWKDLKEFSQQQRVVQDLSEARRQKFLIDYIQHGSQAAVYLLLKIDGEFASKKVDDILAIKMLDLLQKKTPAAEKFALDLLTSPRTSQVWQTATSRLYLFVGEPPPPVWTYQAALARFAPHRLMTKNLSQVKQQTSISSPPSKSPVKVIKKIEKKMATQPAAVIASKEKLYIVQEGDSLWKIAKRFHSSIEAIKTRNQLKSDLLKPGTVLKIPG